MKSNKEVFNNIYEKGLWGKVDFSGEGSIIENSLPWIDLVNTLIIEKQIKTVLDLGCGDGVLANSYNLSGVEYIGVDVSNRIIEKNNNSNNKTFVSADIENYKYPNVDLIIIKDVLQHLPNNAVIKILSKIETSCKYALICNDMSDLVNLDISAGEHRFLNLNIYPFNKKYKVINRYNFSYYQKVTYLFCSETST